ncbi:MAG: hypothetical protein Q4A92_09480 [Corynebacterium sp.]|nr:hypothetical protein [Corynebacterium sp.]
MAPKYELSEESKINSHGVRLFRIRALRELPAGRADLGDLGGWVEGDWNLAQDGNCWITDDAEVFGSARLEQDAFAENDAKIFGDAHVCGQALASEYAQVCDRASVLQSAIISGAAQVFENAIVGGAAEVWGSAKIRGHVWVHGLTEVVSGTEPAVIGGGAVLTREKIQGPADVDNASHVLTLDSLGLVAVPDITIYRTRNYPYYLVSTCFDDLRFQRMSLEEVICDVEQALDIEQIPDAKKTLLHSELYAWKRFAEARIARWEGEIRLQ